MHCHTCYRVVAACDFIMLVFTGMLWWITYRRTESLIRLQFEVHSPQDSFLPLVPFYRNIIQSVGTGHNDEISSDLLRQIYDRVHEKCDAYYKKSGIKNPLDKKTAKNMEAELLKLLYTCIVLILSSIGVFMIVDGLIIYTTRKGKASNYRLIIFIFFLHLLTHLTYLGPAIKLRVDARFCIPDYDIRPMLSILAVTSLIFKPFQTYVILRYACDVKAGRYVDEISSTDELVEDDAETLAEEQKQMWPQDVNYDPRTRPHKRKEVIKEDQNQNAEILREGPGPSSGGIEVQRTGNFVDIIYNRK